MTCDKSENVAWDANPAAGTRKTLEIAGVEFPFRYCPPGTFTMGSPASETGFWAFRETPHSVTLTRGFWTLETPVTQGMYKAVDGSNPSAFKFGKRFPVENVSWWHCQAFLEALERLNVAPTGFAFRLPWEAEWEYACRAGTSTAYYWGDAWDDARANCGGCQNRDAAPSAKNDAASTFSFRRFRLATSRSPPALFYFTPYRQQFLRRFHLCDVAKPRLLQDVYFRLFY